MSPDTPARRIWDFVIEHVADTPAARRARVYRDLAAIIGDELLARRLTLLADELDEIERRHAQLALDFKRRAG